MSNTKCLRLHFMSETFLNKSVAIKKKFADLSSPEDRYNLLIEMGRALPPLSADLKNSENLVSGCQSILYLSARLQNDLLYFDASSDALISSGLAALLISVYSGESPETILREPPQFLADLGIHASLSPNRSNGLSHIHLRMKQEAVKFFMSLTHS